MTLSPKPRDGGVELAAAVGLHRGGSSQKVPFFPDERKRFSTRAVTFPFYAIWRHLQGEVVIGDVDVTGIVSLVCVVFTPFPMSPCICLVPVVGAYRHGKQTQRTER